MPLGGNESEADKAARILGSGGDGRWGAGSGAVGAAGAEVPREDGGGVDGIRRERTTE